MHKSKSIEDSLFFYKKIKNYFAAQNLSNCIIEISDEPIQDWVIHHLATFEQRRNKRSELSLAKKPFVSIDLRQDGNIRFYYSDGALTQSEVIDTGEILFFYDETFEYISKVKLKKEFLELKKILQGK